MLPLFLAAAQPLPDGGEGPVIISIDGGDVPVVAPALMPAFAKVLAPELVSDGGVGRDGGDAPIVAPQTLSVYQVDLPSEAAITAGTFGLYLVVDILIKPTLAGTASCQQNAGGICNPSSLSAFDRYAVGRDSRPWREFSDVALVTSLVLPTLYLGLESLVLPTKEPWGDFATDLLVITESMALTAAMQTVLKFAFRRPRPTRYLATSTTPTFDEELSLPSGHTCLVAAATTALTTTVFLRHPGSKIRYVVLAAGVALSLATGWSRVEAGQHFPSDVLLGLFIGGFSGFVVPYFHRKDARFGPSVSFNPATGTTMFALSGAL